MNNGEMDSDFNIRLSGVKTNNLKGVSVIFPHSKLCAVIGVSGSGKSSLVFDTLFNECRNRFLESLSPYLRQFIESSQSVPLVEARGLLPALAVRQKKSMRNSRSTVSTVTEIYDYLRVVFAKGGIQHCPKCGAVVRSYAPEDIARWCLESAEQANAAVVFSLRDAKMMATKNTLKYTLQKQGFVRLVTRNGYVRIDELEGGIDDAYVVIDRLRIAEDDEDRLLEALRISKEAGTGGCWIVLGERDLIGSKIPPNIALVELGENVALFFPALPQCQKCHEVTSPLSEGYLSFNNPVGACPMCKGFGDILFYDESLYMDPKKTIRENPVRAWQGSHYVRYFHHFLKWAKSAGLPLDVPYGELDDETKAKIIKGSSGFSGVDNFFKLLERKKYKMHIRVFLSRFRSGKPCPLCGGSRLSAVALSVTIAGYTIADVLAMTVSDALDFVKSIPLHVDFIVPVNRAMAELSARLECLKSLGLGYVELNRSSHTLSGGEFQRVHIAAIVGTRFTDTLFVLDEPTIGLHPRDNKKVLSILKKLCTDGNTVVFVEHDPLFIVNADYIVELGPGAGKHGGEVIFQGPAREWSFGKNSNAIKSLHGRVSGRLNGPFISSMSNFLCFEGANARNLCEINARFPIGCLSCITGVSGSGKSTLLEEVIAPSVRAIINKQAIPCTLRAVKGAGNFDFVQHIDQLLPQASSRSNVATYIGFYTEIRKLFAHTPLARLHGLKPGYFSGNVEGGGRCPQCKGKGKIILEMQFLPDEAIECDACQGKGFTDETLHYTYKGKDIYQVLSMSLEEGMSLFNDIGTIVEKIRFLEKLGLEYLRMGQTLDTLSGGEIQRLKLARFIMNTPSGKGLFLLDEPTTGLHPLDIKQLLDALRMLLQSGHTIVCVEHDLLFIDNSQWILDLGPDGGPMGGRIIYQGWIDGLTSCNNSYTGQALKEWKLNLELQDEGQVL